MAATNQEDMLTKKQTIKKIISLLGQDFPDPKTELHFEKPHQLLVATILSAQCTDVRVNLVTAELFKKYKDVKEFAAADPAELEQDIRSTGFYHHKAKNIIAASQMIREKFAGEVPDKMEELIQLPGVARKTANVVLSGAFGKEEGVAIDTHLIRLTNLLGLATSRDPKIIEQELMAATERKDWSKLSNLLILHGRRVCVARKPRCAVCRLNRICPAADSGDR